jgi:Carbohydrate phosphorylase
VQKECELALFQPFFHKFQTALNRYLLRQSLSGDRNWTRMSILNTARMGKFSSDRAIQEYAEAVWHVKPVKVELDKYIHGDAGLKVETPEAVLS